MSKARYEELMRQSERHFARRQFREAGGIAEQIIAQKATYAPALAMMARIGFALRQFDQAAPFAQRAVTAERRDPFYHVLYGQTLLEQGHTRKAIAAFEKALRLRPGYEEATAGLAEGLERNGKGARAREILAPAIRAGSASPRMALAYARSARAAGDHEAVTSTVNAQLDRTDLPDDARRSLLLVLGRSLDDQGRHDDAFEAFRAANGTAPPAYDHAAEVERFAEIRTAFARSATAGLPRAAAGGETAVFVVGMPRSGSTLIEQIIHAHPQGAGAGEPRHLSQITMRLGPAIGSARSYPACVSDLTPAHVKGVAEEYLRRLRTADARATRIVDKALENFLFLGLVALLLPEAKVIHARRAPMDLCFSCYMHDLRHPWAFDLGTLGRYHRLYADLMQFWHTEIDLPILDVDYESLVADQAGESRRIIDFVGLPWDDACLRYFEAKRQVATISYDQVRKPIYQNAAGRFRRYEGHLGALREALGE
ncbi:MAG: tetratricopeptide repeat protein [Phycisphaerales bacterium]|nr:tetratricopeptide repeat protein [Phycisphaerales bacterium]